MQRVILLGLLLFSGIALGQVAAPATACAGWWCPLLAKFPEVNAWLVAIFTFCALVLRATADLLGFIGQQLANGQASAWAVRVGAWAVWAARILGWFGAGTPAVAKQVIVNKAQEKANG